MRPRKRPTTGNRLLTIEEFEEANRKITQGLFDETLREVKTEEAAATQPSHDPVNHPSHYTSHPSGVEAITITEHFSFNLGNAVKYIWRHSAQLATGATQGAKPLEDLRKAKWYVEREIERLVRGGMGRTAPDQR